LTIDGRHCEIIHAMSATNGSKTTRARFLRSALMLAGCVLLVALLIAPLAAGKSGSGSLAGLALAAAICLLTGWAAESLSCLLHGRVTPLAVMLLGMAIRMAPPLGICVALAALGASGRAHLAFIVYLLAFYLVTLALETWLAVGRVAHTTTPSKSIAR
jgi:hypothetical protein